jgi:hypothetical protein
MCTDRRDSVSAWHEYGATGCGAPWRGCPAQWGFPPLDASCYGSGDDAPSAVCTEPQPRHKGTPAQAPQMPSPSSAATGRMSDHHVAASVVAQKPHLPHKIIQLTVLSNKTQSSWMWRCVGLVWADVLEEHTTSVWVCSHLLMLVPLSLISLPWRWRRYVPSKRRFTQDLHSATSEKMAFFIVTAVKTSNLTKRRLITI